MSHNPYGTDDPKQGLNRSKQIFGKYMLVDEGMADYKVERLLGLQPHDTRLIAKHRHTIPDMRDCFYVAGPMSGHDHCNFISFDNASDALREAGIEVVSPAELDSDEGRTAALESLSGDNQATQGDSEWTGFLERDLRVVAGTAGTIVIDKWWESNGAKLETFVADKLGKELLGVFPDVEPIERKEWVERGLVKDY